MANLLTDVKHLVDNTVTEGAALIPEPIAGIANATVLSLLALSVATAQKIAPRTKRKFDEQYDFIIVGSGTAGSVLAGRLSEDSNFKVLVLEAGKAPPTLTDVPGLAPAFIGSDIDWRHMSVPQEHGCKGLVGRRLKLSAGKVLGGTNIYNGMLYVRGNRKDFDKWAENGATGWSYREVLKYFKKAEGNTERQYVDKGYHNFTGPITVGRPNYNSELKEAVQNAANELGAKIIDVNGRHQIGFYNLQSTIRRGQRCSPLKAYLAHNDHRQNLDIIAEALVTKIQVKADLPVGHNMQDHSGTIIPYRMDDNIQGYDKKLMNPLNVGQYIATRSGPFTSSSLASFIIFATVDGMSSPDAVPDFEVILAEGAVNQLAADTLNVDAETYEKAYTPFTNKSCYLCIAHNLHPRSSGTVKLNSSNVDDDLIINPHIFQDPRDLDNAVAAAKMCERVANTEALREIGSFTPKTTLCNEFLDNEDEYLRCRIEYLSFNFFHIVGTARMGDPSKRDTVVTPELRVKGIKNLRVVDASVMPHVTSGNLQTPVVMIAEKAADMIKEAHSD